MKIENLITEDNIIFDESIDSKDRLFEKVSEVLLTNKIISDRDIFIKDLFAREAEAPTGLIDGFGIPHAQSSAVLEPSLVFIKAGNIKDYETMDEGIVSTAFVIAVPATGGSDHLEILSNLARRLMKDGFRKNLKNSQTKEEVLLILKGEEL